MHETALLSRVVRLVEERLADRPGCRPVTVRIRVSPWSHLAEHDGRTLSETFSMLAAGTRAQGAVLEIKKTPVHAACPTCGQEQAGDEAAVLCHTCGSTILSLTEVPEVWLQDIEVEEG